MILQRKFLTFLWNGSRMKIAIEACELRIAECSWFTRKYSYCRGELKKTCNKFDVSLFPFHKIVDETSTISYVNGNISSVKEYRIELETRRQYMPGLRGERIPYRTRFDYVSVSRPYRRSTIENVFSLRGSAETGTALADVRVRSRTYASSNGSFRE